MATIKVNRPPVPSVDSLDIVGLSPQLFCAIYQLLYETPPVSVKGWKAGTDAGTEWRELCADMRFVLQQEGLA